MDKKFDVISFGSAIVDIFLQSKEFKLIKNKEGGVSICGVYGDKIDIERKLIASGGGGTNTGVSFARLGLKAGVVARMGNDFFGQLIAKELGKEGIAIDLMAIKEEETDISVILVGPDGGRTILVSRGSTKLEEEDINWQTLEADWFYLASLEGNLDLVEKLINFSKEKGIAMAWNPGKKELLEKKRLIQLINQVKVFNLNREEMEELIEEKMENKKFFWEKVKNLEGEIIVVTDGRQGAYLWSKSGLVFKKAPATTPVDETGAGDAFGSGFVAGLIKRMSLEEAFDLAMRNGSSVVRKIGAKTGLIREL